MNTINYNALLKEQRDFYQTGETRTIAFRINQLTQLKNAILNYEVAITKALRDDLGKSEHETMTTEIGFTLLEISTAIKNLRKWDTIKKVKTNLFNRPGKSFIMREPYGTTLVIGPWNYPFQLALAPVIGAISGGNTVIIKPSEMAEKTARVLTQMIEETFDRAYIGVVNGGVEETSALLNEHFDLIFFTGSPKVGKIIMEKAAKHLTPVILELGGKSPCIVDETAKLDIAVRRIIFGKGTNAGQTCVAPDYLLLHESQKEAFYQLFNETAESFYGKNSIDNPQYGSIIHEQHYLRLKSFLKEGKLITGGQFDDKRRRIALTLLEIENGEATVMQEEIFGPILPVITYKNEEEIYHWTKKYPDPLALYIFSQNEALIQRILQRIPFGGGCINDTILHLTNEHLPFGGRGNSGQGNYHGRRSFEAFTHEKSIYRGSTRFDLKLKYPPYDEKNKSMIKRLLYK